MPYFYLEPLAPEQVDLRIQFRGQSIGNRQSVTFSWDRQRPEKGFRFNAAAVEYLEFRPYSFSLEVRYCTVRFNDTPIEVGNESVILNCETRGGGDPIVFTLGKEPVADEGVEFLFGRQEKGTLLARFFPPSDPLQSIQFDKVSSGKLGLIGDKTVDLIKDFVYDPKTQIVGSVLLGEFDLKDDDFHIKAKGTTSSILVDENQQVSDQLARFIRVGSVPAMIALLAWLLDKMLSFYGARKASTPSSPTTPAGTTGSP